jgi:hypothetical protein
MLGYSETSKNGYIIWVIRTRTVTVRTNVIFDEHPPDDPDFYPNLSITEKAQYDSLLSELAQYNNPADITDQGGESESELAYAVANCGEEDTPYVYDDQLFPPDEDWYDYSGLSDREKSCIDEYILLHKFELPPNPKSVYEALQGEHGKEWFEVIMKELKQLENRPTYKDASQEGRAHKSKLVLRYMYRNDYSLKLKARWVICGYSQIPGVDYNDTYAPTTSTYIVFLLMLIAATRKIKTATFDVTGAFLEGAQDIKQYARFPADIMPPGERPTRVEIIGNWYGTVQAPFIWHTHLSVILIDKLGMERCKVMSTLFYKYWYDADGKVIDYLFITIHVDDGQLVAQCGTTTYDWFIAEFKKYVRNAELSLTYERFLGMDIKQSEDNNYFDISHETYIEDKLREYQKPFKTPMLNTINLRTATPNQNNKSLLPITGTLRFPADRARPDILAAVGEVSCGGAKFPSDLHVQTADRICNYLLHTKSLCLRLGGEEISEKFAYVDASYNQEAKSLSRIGACMFYNLTSGAVWSISRNSLCRDQKYEHFSDDEDTDVEHNDSTLSHSSCESEINGIVAVGQEVEFQREVDKALKLECADKCVRVLVDSKSAILLCKTLKSPNKTKHINMRINYIRELINARIISLHFIGTDANVADMLTKALPTVVYERHSKIIMHGHNGISPFNSDSVYSMEQIYTMIELENL